MKEDYCFSFSSFETMPGLAAKLSSFISSPAIKFLIGSFSGLGALKKWRLERGWDPNNPMRRIVAVEACEHIVVLNKRDLVPAWGMEVNLNNL